MGVEMRQIVHIFVSGDGSSSFLGSVATAAAAWSERRFEN